MLDPNTPARERSNLLDVFQLVLSVHLVAESRVLTTLVSIVRPPTELRLQIAQLRTDHVGQQLMLDRLDRTEVGSTEWCAGVGDLREMVHQHAKREDYLRGAIADHVPSAIGRGLVAEYATERMRVLTNTSPVVLAHRLGSDYS